MTPWTAARQASLSITNSRSSPKLTSIDAVTQALKQVGVEAAVPLKDKAPYVIGVFTKENWAKAQASDKQLGVLVDRHDPERVVVLQVLVPLADLWFVFPSHGGTLALDWRPAVRPDARILSGAAPPGQSAGRGALR